MKNGGVSAMTMFQTMRIPILESASSPRLPDHDPGDEDDWDPIRGWRFIQGKTIGIYCGGEWHPRRVSSSIADQDPGDEQLDFEWPPHANFTIGFA